MYFYGLYIRYRDFIKKTRSLLFIYSFCFLEINWCFPTTLFNYILRKKIMTEYSFDAVMNAIPEDHARQSTSTDIAEEALLSSETKILTLIDLGCGTGRHSEWLKKFDSSIRYIGIDIENSPEVQMRKKDGLFVTYDGFHLPFKSSNIDIFFSNQTLEHVRKPHLLLPEISRCLKDDGLFVGSVSQLEPYHSYSVLNYTFYGIYCLFKEFGLDIIKLRPGIDAVNLIQRSFNKFILKRNHVYQDLFFGQESPLNYSLNVLADKEKWNIKKLNLEKLKISGQICFVAKKTIIPCESEKINKKRMYMRSYENVLETNPELRGNTRYCNICGYRFAKFLNFNKLRPREALCPVCYSLERHRHLWMHIFPLYPFLDKKRILHFAPEKIFKQIFQESQADYYDADIDPKKARYKVDITDIPFKDNYFDYIICIHVLEHILDDILAIKELYRVLKEGGIAFLAVPLRQEAFEDSSIIEPEDRVKVFGQCDHVRWYSEEVFLKGLIDGGFNIELISDPKKFPVKFCNETLMSEKFFLARKC